MFRFRLEAVHKIRQNVEEQAQLELGRQQTKLQKQQQRLTSFNQQRQEMISTMSQKQGRLNGALMQLYSESLAAKELQSSLLQAEINKQQLTVDQARHRLSQAVKQRKIIDTLRQRDLLRYQQEMALKEQQESDEMAVLRYSNNDYSSGS